MIKVALVRGKYLNNFEGQSYIFNPNQIQLTGVASLKPIHSSFPFPIIKFFSLADINLGKVGKILFNRILGDSQILFGIEQIANEFDIFHTADPHYYYSYQLAKLKKNNLIKKFIVTSWETIPFNNETVKRKKFIKYFTLKYSDKFICYTDLAKQTLIKEGVDRNKISLVRLGVDLNKFGINKREIRIKKTNNLTILFVGRLVEEKGILDLYETFKRIKNKKVRLKIIGEGPLKAHLIKSIRQDGLNNFVSLEKKEYDEMPEVYQKADIFVLPSKKTKTWQEQYGMVLVEAMASGLPVVASISGSVPEIIGEAGILLAKNNIDNLSKTMFKLVSDDNLRAKLGRMGRERAKKEFDSKNSSKKLKRIYENISHNSNKK